MTPPEERTVRANGLDHHVLVWNDGGAETVVLCHGFLDHAWSWRWVAPHLAAAGFRVVAHDWRGHGQSEWIGPGGYYHFPDYVLDLHELWPSIVGERPAHLVGHSMGGGAAVLFAGSHPGLLQTLSVLEGLGPPNTQASAQARLADWLTSVTRERGKQRRAMETLDDAVRRLRSTQGAVDEEILHAVAETGTVRGDDGLLRWRFDPMHRTTAPNVFRAEDFGTFLDAIDVPTLVVTGEKGYWTSDHAERVARVPQVTERTLPRVGHMMHWLAPEPLAALLLAHIRRA